MWQMIVLGKDNSASKIALAVKDWSPSENIRVLNQKNLRNP